ncbi:hypothetical protein [Nocardioides ochotonae]|uniref:hypothetical protein n=1 Tax=Nocardioides ochotonae TaxID=2685869 RepID=UPI00140937E1|nr:hypothetical protein [Nocardioides ochotonae]
MSTPTLAPPSTNARALLLPYALGLLAAAVVLQAVIALAGGEITVLAGVLTAVLGVGIAAWLLRHHRELAHVRFGFVVAHSLAFVMVTTSFNAHAVIRTLQLGATDGGFEVAAQELLATPWFGATLVMSAAWGCGLLVHLVGSVLGRGWDR